MKTTAIAVLFLSFLLISAAAFAGQEEVKQIRSGEYDVAPAARVSADQISGIIKWEETFDDVVIPAGWQVVDNDGSGTFFDFVQQISFTSGDTVNPEAGQSFWFSNFTNANAAGLIDEWIISPGLPTIEAGDSLHFYAGAIGGTFDDSLKVWVSTTDSLPGSFTDQIGYFKVDGPTGAWNKYSFDLSAYDGMDIYIAVNYYIVDGGPAGTHSDNVWVDHFVLEGEDTMPPDTPELMWYKFDEAGEVWTQNFADPATAVNDSAQVLGSLSMGGTGQTGSALVGASASSTDSYVNTEWATNLTDSWTISFWINGLGTTSLSYIFGDNTTGFFRCFTGGAAGANGLLLRTGSDDVTITGVGPDAHKIDFVYDATIPEIRAYVDGVLQVTVFQTTPLSIVGTGPFKIGGYSSSTGMPSGSLMDDFKLYTRPVDVQPIGDDYAATNFVDLPPSYFADSTYTISANIKNLGDNAQSNVPVRFFVDGGQVGGDELVSLASGDSATVSYSWTPTVAQNYDLTIQTFLPGDEVPENDAVETTVTVMGGGPPVIGLSPDSFDVSLTPTQMQTETLTISNSGLSALDFSITIEGAAARSAKVDIIADRKARGAGIRAVGKPVPLAELEKMRGPFKRQITINPLHPEDSAEPVDLGLASKSAASNGLNKIGNPVELLGEEVFGSNANGFTAGPRTRGNLFSCTTSTTLTEHRLYLSPSTATQMWFVVYEGDAQVGIYDLVSAADVTPQGPGEGWYSSGAINVPMEAGKFYVIAASFEASTTYYNQQDIVPYPIPASFGELTAGAGWNWAPTSNFPPDPTQDVPASAFGAAVAYYQTIVTGAGTSWVTVDTTAGSVPAGDSVDIDVTFDAAGLLGGDYDADIVVSSNDPVNPVVSTHAHLFVIGEVSISAGPDPLVFPNDVFVNGSDTDTLWVKNDGNGLLSVSDVTSSNAVFTPAMTAFDVPPFDSVGLEIEFAPTAAGTETGTLSIASNDPNTPSLDVSVEGTAVDPPVISVDIDSIVVGLAEGDSTDVPILITNNGGADLDWSAMAVEGEARMGEPVIVEGYQVESHAAYRPDLPQIHFVGREMWDLQLSFDMEAATGANGNAGAEFDGTYFYSTRWASNLLHKYDLSGNLVEEFSITGVSGLRDLAWDGTYMYGGNAANTIYQIDVATNTVVGTISSPVPVRHIAYDEGADGFWVGNWDTDIVLVDRSGTTVATITAATHGLANMYGSAYDGYSADGPYLWMFDQGPAGIGGESFIVQIDLNTLSPTGELYDVGADFAAAAPIAGGLWISGGVVEGTVSIGGVAQGVPDNYFVYELGEAGPGYFTLIGETSGTIAPGDVGGVVARMYGAPADTVIHGSIVITSNDPLTPMITIPVTIEPPLGIEDVSAIPTAYRVDPNYPNPFNPTTTIHYQLPVAGDVKLVIYNILGQKVRTLVQSRVEAGRHNAVWDGRNDAGATVGSGVYVYRFEAGSDYSSIRKMILLK